jgi:dTDP-4-amino-4,6-dideoxygalactose transaminase
MMPRTIGGRPSAPPRDYFTKPGRQATRFPFGNPCSRYFFSARYALAAGIRSLGLRAGDEALLPAYTCGVEIDPFLYHGIQPRYYRIGTDLQTDIEDLRKRLTENVKAVLVTHFLGFPQPIEEIRAICDERNVFLLEDCAHALLSSSNGRDLGSLGDIAVFSLLKTLPVPNGGILVINNESVSCVYQHRKPSRFGVVYYLADLWRQKTNPEGSAAVLVEKLVSAVLWRGMNVVKRGIAALRTVTGKMGTALIRPDSFAFAPEIMEWDISPASLDLINNTDFDMVKESRRRNFSYLLERLTSSECREEFGFPVESLPDGVCPLFFPLLVEGNGTRYSLYQYLKQEGITSHPWWPDFHPSVPWEEYPEARSLKERLFGIPIHQDLTFKHLDRVVVELEKKCRELRRRHV